MSYFNHNGFNIYYEIKGDQNSKNTVAFLNGVMASRNSWVNQIPIFEKLGYKIILHDFKGQLLSDKPQGPYTFKEHAAEAKALLDFLGVEKAHLIGTSYGGEVAMRFAVDYPEITESISIINSVSELDDVLKLLIRNWRTLAKQGDPVEFFHGMLPTIYHSNYIKDNIEILTTRAQAFKNLPEDYLKGQIYLYDTFEQDVTMTHILKEIKCPALVVCGEDDILKPKKFAQIIADNIPRSEYITIPNCAHVTIFEKPNELNSVLLGFVFKNS